MAKVKKRLLTEEAFEKYSGEIIKAIQGINSLTYAEQAQLAASEANKSKLVAETKAGEASGSATNAAASAEAAKKSAEAAAKIVDVGVDPTLSVEGAAADSKMVGENFGKLKEEAERTENLENKYLSTSWVRGYINNNGVVLNASFRAVTSDYLIKSSDVTVSVSDGYQFAVAYADTDGTTSLARAYGTDSFIIPANTKFKVSVYAKPEDTSNGLIDATEYGKTVIMTYRTALLRKVSKIDELANQLNNQINNQSAHFIYKKYKDIFENKMCHVGKIVNAGMNTSYVDNSSFSSSEFIPVKPETTYVFVKKSEAYGYVTQGITRKLYYNSKKEYLTFEEGSASPVITTPKNCKYIIFSTMAPEIHDSFDDIIIEESDEIAVPLDKGFAKNSLTEKKWMVIGDSITEKNFRAAANYHDFIRSETGCEILNCGVSGSGYAMMHSSNKAFRDRIPTYSAMTPDCITIMGGINDVLFAHQGGKVATIDDIGVYTDTSETSVMGCVYLAYVQILATFPNTPFGIMSPVPHADYSPQKQDDNVLAYFVEELAKFCKYYGVPFLDQYHFSNLRPWDATYNQRFFSCTAAVDGDGLHPNYYGHKVIYPKIREFIKTLI